MHRINSAEPVTHPHARRPLKAALTGVLLSLLTLGPITTPAHAAAGEDPLLAAVSCPHDGNTGTTWDSVEAQRAAVACLINKVRVQDGGEELFNCRQDRMACNFHTTNASRKTQMANLSQAAQWKAMNVGYMCNSDTYFEPRDQPGQQWHIDDPHYACDRPVDYFLTQLKVQRASMTENLAPGYPNFLRLDAAGRGIPITPREVVNSWLHSGGHRANLLDDRAFAFGVGVSPAWHAGTKDGEVGVAPQWGSYRQVYSAQFIR